MSTKTRARSKELFQACWASSDSQKSFTAALADHGYVLARGDRRGFVALDYRGEVYAVSKWVGVKAKEVRARMSNESALPSVDQVRTQIAADISARLSELSAEQLERFNARITKITKESHAMAGAHAAERAELARRQNKKLAQERQVWQSRFRKGLKDCSTVSPGDTRRRLNKIHVRVRSHTTKSSESNNAFKENRQKGSTLSISVQPNLWIYASSG